MSAWTFQVNDPTLIAWGCLIGYLVAAISSFGRVRQVSAYRERLFWFGVALSCGLLALNKQLDVHSALLGLIRNPEAGRPVAWLISIAFGVISLAAAFLMLRGLPPPSPRMIIAFGALGCLGAILVGRNTVPGLSNLLGFHLTTETETLLHLHVSELFELVLAGVIWKAARPGTAGELRIPPDFASRERA